ncbi:hypothetical protein [uncultured Nocardioides sp.]|uniref:hypothetical protein n=1 Tax=uncultured Nocardioides sp. TaxID=198441 RepID=UPI002623748E|nr:hypothetical protein [uncultured Nocardioides sp.]
MYSKFDQIRTARRSRHLVGTEGAAVGFFSKKSDPMSRPTAATTEPLPTVSPADLAAGTQLMDQFDVSLGGGSDAIYTCLEQIATRGGWKGEQATMMEAIQSPNNTAFIQQRPWRYWSEVARLANASGEHDLAGRIFLFAHLYATQMASKMSWQDRASIGLEAPEDSLYKAIAAAAVDSLARLDRGYLIHNTATGKVDVAAAIGMAEAISGVTAPPPAASPASSTAPAADDASPFNQL